MATLIAYASGQGCVKKCVKSLVEQLKGEVEVCNLVADKAGDISGYDTIIIGGSIRAGNIQKEVKQFCHRNLTALITKKIGLFICCMDEKNYDKYVKTVFPQELLEHTAAIGYFGYELYLSKMNFIMRKMLEYITKVKEDKSCIYEENIKEFGRALDIG